MECIVTTLSILVTLLIGWNIYSILSFEYRLKKHAKKVVKKEFETVSDSYNLALFDVHFNLCKVYGDQHNEEFAASTLFKALFFADKITDKDTFVGCINIAKPYLIAAVPHWKSNDRDRRRFAEIIYKKQWKCEDVDDIIRAYESL